PALERLGERGNHAAILPLEELPHRRRKHDRSRAGMAVHKEIHVAAERRTVPAVKFAVHDFGNKNSSIGPTRAAQLRSLCSPSSASKYSRSSPSTQPFATSASRRSRESPITRSPSRTPA